jgi:hypothetical protein
MVHPVAKAFLELGDREAELSIERLLELISVERPSNHLEELWFPVFLLEVEDRPGNELRTAAQPVSSSRVGWKTLAWLDHAHPVDATASDVDATIARSRHVADDAAAGRDRRACEAMVAWIEPDDRVRLHA